MMTMERVTEEGRVVRQLCEMFGRSHNSMLLLLLQRAGGAPALFRGVVLGKRNPLALTVSGRSLVFLGHINKYSEGHAPHQSTPLFDDETPRQAV